MKINELYENAYSELDYTRSKKIIKKYYDAIELALDRPQIWRGMRIDKLAFFVDANSLRRKASQTENICNKVIDILPSWKDWPKRTRSVIGTVSENQARNYGPSQYLLFPLENQPIGICTGDKDFWNCFPVIIPTINKYIIALYKRANEITGQKQDFLRNDSAKTIISRTQFIIDNLSIEEIENVLSTKGFRKAIMTTMIDIMENSKNALDFYNTILDPTYGNALIQNIGELSSGNKGEVWMTGKVLIIKEQLFNVIWKDLHNEIL